MKQTVVGSVRSERADVAIYGGGVAGAMLAKELSRSATVTLVDPKTYFEVPMAAPRNLVAPAFAERAIIPFRDALPQVPFVLGRLTELRRDGGVVTLANGRTDTVSARVSVLATGSRYANPLMRAVEGGDVAERLAFYRRFHDRVAAARRILIVGGGPIGVEVAGEIVEANPAAAVTMIELGARILAGTSRKAADRAAHFLAARNVTILTGDRLDSAPSGPEEVLAPGGVAMTAKGRRIEYDLLIWCIGGRPETAYMRAHFADVLDDRGRIRVTPALQVLGETTLFALGDITDLDENKMAWHIDGQRPVARDNILAVLGAQDGAPLHLKSYAAQTGNPKMAVTLGSRHGVVHLPPLGVVSWSPLVRSAKAAHMLVPRYRKMFGVA